MKICTFFGHRECPGYIKPRLYQVLRRLIEKENVDVFYVGNQGQFDSMAKCVLRELKSVYPRISYMVVLAYVPTTGNTAKEIDDTILPEGIEQIPPRYAINWRNNWMLERADYVVGYITSPCGGAAKFYQKAIQKGRTVVNLGEDKPANTSNESV